MANPALISVADGNTAAGNVTDGQLVHVTPGQLVTVALQSSTGVKRWILAESGSSVLRSGMNAGSGFTYEVNQDGPFSVQLQMPLADAQLRLVSSTTDGQTESHVSVILNCQKWDAGVHHRVRGVLASNSNTANCSVTVDGLTCVAGDKVLLAAQTTQAQNGPWVFGTVTSGYAPLTRPADYAAGDIIKSPVVVEVEAGTSYGGQTWRSSQTGAITIDTTSVTFYPKTIKGNAALSSGNVTVSSLFVASGAIPVCCSNSAVNAVQVNVVTAGVGTGSVSFKGTGSDSVNYVILNF